MKRLLLFLMALHFSLSVRSQRYELGEVTTLELEEKFHPTDTSAVAAFLFKKAQTEVQYTYLNASKTTYSIKIKIYKKEGLSLANFEIPFYIGYKSDEDVIEVSNAFTYNLENGTIVKTKVPDEGKFIEKHNDYHKSKMILFPNVKPGSIVELQYRLTTRSLPAFQYQHTIPVNYAMYMTTIPEYFTFKAVRTGFVPLTAKNWSEDVKLKLQGYEFTSLVKYTQVKTIYSAKNIPPLITERYVDNMDNYFASLELELERTALPKRPVKQISTTWQDVATSLYDHEDFGVELDKYKYFFSELEKMLKDEDTDRQKTEKVFHFVRDRMTWNERYGYFTRKGVEKAYQDKTGNVAEINLILTAMLKMSGLTAEPVLISTRDNGLALLPNRSKFNYVIACVELEKELLLLDATDKNSQPNLLPFRDLNSVGRAIRKDGSSAEVNLMPKNQSKDVISVIASIEKDGTVNGKMKEQHFDYNAYRFRCYHADLLNEAQLERIEKKHEGIEVEAYAVENAKALDQPVVESYNFSSKNSVEIIGNKMYCSPLLFMAIEENPFKQDQRLYPIYYAYPLQDKYAVAITIPEGYAIETLPASVSIPMSNNLGLLKYNIAASDKIIQLSVIMEINSAIIDPAHYDELKAFYTEVVKKQTEKVVLKKI